MNRFDRDAIGELILRVSWKSDNCDHHEYFRCSPVNLWRDILPPELETLVLHAEEGSEFRVKLSEPPFPYQKNLVHTLPRNRWQKGSGIDSTSPPRLGRWYPQGFAAGLPGIFSESIRPMRVIAMDAKSITVDCNHPLAGRELELGATIGRISSKSKERGGRCASWLDDATEDGPGMQALHTDLRPDFLDSDSMQRSDEQLDTNFYQAPRLVGHIDRQASWQLQSFFREALPEDIHLLDLMAGYQSHLPPDFKAKVVGLGMNDEEMKENPAILEQIVQDLNQSPTLPFSEESFEAVICNLSFEYLIQPLAVLQEVLRILKPGGQLIFSVSDRWFPPKVTRVWTRLHPFERMGYILDYLRADFGSLSTTSYRGWPRPGDDPHPLPLSDPLFIISGRKPERTS